MYRCYLVLHCRARPGQLWSSRNPERLVKYYWCFRKSTFQASCVWHVQYTLTHDCTYSYIMILPISQYPEHHQVGHQSIDVHFRNIPGVLHTAVDLREDFTFYLLHFKELVGHGPQASLSDCIELLAARATSAGLSLCLQEQGEVSCPSCAVSFWVTCACTVHVHALPWVTYMVHGAAVMKSLTVQWNSTSKYWCR